MIKIYIQGTAQLHDRELMLVNVSLGHELKRKRGWKRKRKSRTEKKTPPMMIGLHALDR